MIKNYYARLNENQIAVEIVSTVKDYNDIKDYIELENYNESILYRKWEGNQWSSERYEPEIKTIIQEKLKELEEQNINKDKQINSLDESLSELLMMNMKILSEIQELKGVDK